LAFSVLIYPRRIFATPGIYYSILPQKISASLCPRMFDRSKVSMPFMLLLSAGLGNYTPPYVIFQRQHPISIYITTCGSFTTFPPCSALTTLTMPQPFLKTLNNLDQCDSLEFHTASTTVKYRQHFHRRAIFSSSQRSTYPRYLLDIYQLTFTLAVSAVERIATFDPELSYTKRESNGRVYN
jgi:hypothetical protein